MALEPSKHVNGRMWPPGVSGNPNGRPVGSRTVFSQSFLKDLASVWAERGRAAMEKTAIDQPGVFFATCARLIGPEVKLTIEQTLPGNLSMEDWQVMREIVAAVRQAIPDAEIQLAFSSSNACFLIRPGAADRCRCRSASCPARHRHDTLHRAMPSGGPLETSGFAWSPHRATANPLFNFSICSHGTG